MVTRKINVSMKGEEGLVTKIKTSPNSTARHVLPEKEETLLGENRYR